MKKKVFSLLMIFVMVLSLLPASVFADALPDAFITVPSDAKLYVGAKGQVGGKDTHFVPFSEVQPTQSIQNVEAGTTTYYFELSNGKQYNYRVSGLDYVSYMGIFTKTADFSLEITEAMLKPVGKTKTTIDYDSGNNGGFNVADVYLNINPQGYLKLSDVGSTYQLINIRNWQAVDSTTNNYFIEPDFHYTIVDENGNPDSSVVTVSDSGLITAVNTGTAIVLVTYDAMNNVSAVGGPFFGAIWPENTGVFVVSVGAGESGIQTGMTINEGRNTDATTQKMSLDALDAELDVIYYTGTEGSYTFTPKTEGCNVFVARPTVADKLSFSGFVSVSKNADNSFSVPLSKGRNIVKIEKDGGVEYQIISAKHVDCIVNDGLPVIPGDTVKIVFNTLYHPANKLAGIYNMSALAIYNDVQGYEEKLIGTSSAQYNYASNVAAQTVVGGITKKNTAYGVSYTQDTKTVLTIPADYQDSEFCLKDGYFVATGYGDPFGNHRGITLTAGKAPNLNASMREGFMGKLPDISVPVTALDSLAVITQPALTNYHIGDSFDSTGMVVKANYANGNEVEINNYSFSKDAFSASGEQKVEICYKQGNTTKTAQVNVMVSEAELDHIAISTAPNKTAYQVNENFDPTGMVVTAYYSDGSSRIITNYSLSHGKLISTDEMVTVNYNGKTASQDVTVTGKALSSIAITTKPSKMNYKIGDVLDPTGLVVTATYNDDTKAVVTNLVSYDGTAFSSVSSNKTVKVSYTENGITKTANISNIKVTAVDPAEPQPETVTVSFTLLGDDSHDSAIDGNIHTLKAGNLSEWVGKTSVTVNSGAKVIDVIARVLGSKGIPYSNPSGNYIDSIRGLAEFTNGDYSGWMYTLNGKHAKLGVAEQTVKNGDDIVLHYTDDYTREQGSEEWSEPYSAPDKKDETKTETIKETVETKPVEVKDGKADVSIDEKALNNKIDSLVKSAGDKSSEQVVEIKAEVKGDANEVSVGLPTASLSKLAEKTEATVDVQTPNGNVAMPSEALKEIVNQAGKENIEVKIQNKAPEDVKQSVASKLAEVLKDAPAKADGTKFDEKLLDKATVVDIKISAGDKNITGFNGNSITVSVPVDAKKFKEGKFYRTFIQSSDGSLEAKAAHITDGNAEVETSHLSTFVITEEEVSPFIDIDIVNDWFAESATKAFEKKIMNGVGGNMFDAYGTFTRAMIVQVLYNLEGKPVTEYKMTFTDVAEDTWYADAVRWAQSTGIVGGFPDGSFAPNGAVTREQTALILMNYAKYKKLDVTKRNVLNEYSDMSKISSWALDAVKWANALKLIIGSDNKLNPTGDANRAEAAAILVRFIENVK